MTSVATLTVVGLALSFVGPVLAADDEAPALLRLEHAGWQITGTPDPDQTDVIRRARLARGHWRVSAQNARVDGPALRLGGVVRASSPTSYLTTTDAELVDGHLVAREATVFVDDWQLRAARVSIDPQSDTLELQYPGADTDHRQRTNAPEE